MIVPMSLIDRNKYLKRHWSSWTDEDITLDRERATERLKLVPANRAEMCQGIDKHAHVNQADFDNARQPPESLQGG